MILLALLAASILMTLLMNRFGPTRKLLKQSCPINTHRSFVLDLPLLLPLAGLLVEILARRITKTPPALFRVRRFLYIAAISLFLGISVSLYLNRLSLLFLTPVLGHPQAWGGNHFMWNSGMEVFGFKPLIDTTTPTFKNFLGFRNILAIFLFALYPLVMIRAGARLHGLLFGYTEKQTGALPIFWERKKRN